MTDIFVAHDIVEFATWLYSEHSDGSADLQVIIENPNPVAMIDSIRIYLNYKGDHEIAEAAQVPGDAWSLKIRRVPVELIEDE
jgi:hypothetical protein